MKYLIIFALLLSGFVHADLKDKTILDVPTVRQGKMLCGPATLEMIFRYWGESRYTQYDIAKSLLNQFPNSNRYKKSGIFETYPIDWLKYPGTGTINMQRISEAIW